MDDLNFTDTILNETLKFMQTSLLWQEDRGEFVPSQAIVSNKVREIIADVISNASIFVICCLGIVGNCITLAVFYKQGYKETINISLTAIAIWDLIKCVTGLTHHIKDPISLFSQTLQLTYFAYSLHILGYTSTFCTYVSSALAGYVAVERCLCVSLPFSVKYILTPKVATSAMVILSVLTFGSCVVIYPIHKVVWVHHSRFNTTVARLIYSATHFKYPFLFKFYNTVGFLWPALSLAVQSVCTWIISYHLRKASKIRSNTSDSFKVNEGKEMSNRDRQVTKMLLVIISIYMVNMLPRLTIAIAKATIPGFYLFLYYHNLFMCCMGLELTFDCINASINPLVYYFLSSQYKSNILEIFCSRRGKT